LTIKTLELDVRPILAGGSDPFAEIMAAVAALVPGQDLRIVAPFRPAPLIQVLGSKGFASSEEDLGGGAWAITFRRREDGREVGAPAPADDEPWPAPVRQLDNRDLDPPEPMVRILAAAEEMSEGQVLSALLRREPTFLLPELAKRGHVWRGAFEAEAATYRLLVRIGAARDNRT
jgi:uncharacterized protein (DUF2249 family)